MSLYDRVDELEQLNDSKSRQLARAESTIDTLKVSNDTLRRSFDRDISNMKSENIAMKQKVGRNAEAQFSVFPFHSTRDQQRVTIGITTSRTTLETCAP